MMRSKEFYEGSISRLQKMVKHGVTFFCSMSLL
nr:MAG TPA: hypothetical protein [Caudoviricetes sp.]